MLKSLVSYGSNFGQLLKTATGRKLILQEIQKLKKARTLLNTVNQEEKENTLTGIMQWFLFNQSEMRDNGLGTYRLHTGWTSSYPETTGYIVPTLLKYSQLHHNPATKKSAQKALEWLLSIQKPSGGWQSGYIDQNRDEIVFNTAQVIRGMVAGYQYFKDSKYLKSAEAACNWLCKIQDKEGSFSQHVYMNKSRVYESYSVAPMLYVWEITQNNAYKEAAIKHIEWIIKNKQHANGWFEDCDNTIHRNSKPILHTIAYTIDGILDCGLILHREDFVQSAKKPSDYLLDYFLKHQTLPGRWDKEWIPSEALITTGCAQMGIVWHKLYAHTKEKKYHRGLKQINALLTAIANRDTNESKHSKGAIFGSFPFWGRYENFSCPNWASKYLADSLMAEQYA